MLLYLSLGRQRPLPPLGECLDSHFFAAPVMHFAPHTSTGTKYFPKKRRQQ